MKRRLAGIVCRMAGHRVARWLPLCSVPLLTGCKLVLLHPSGDLAVLQRNLIVTSTALMLLIVVPVMVLTGAFAWRYRESNTNARYDPDFHHSATLELVIWAAPLLIIIALGAITWITTHTQDPFRPIARLAPGRPVPAGTKPLRVEVVALDWKWLFLYPDYGIASVNEMAAPVDVPINLQITSVTVMNTFSVPALAGMIYAMPAMETQLHAVINQPGDYEGRSANYSGAGFSDMRFHFLGLSPSDFQAWLEKARHSGSSLDRDSYQALAKPSQREAVRHYAKVAPGLYHAILNLCVERGKMCVDDMAAIDAKGGLGFAGIYNVSRLRYDRTPGSDAKDDRPGDASYVLALCAPDRDPIWSPAPDSTTVASPLRPPAANN